MGLRFANAVTVTLAQGSLVEHDEPSYMADEMLAVFDLDAARGHSHPASDQTPAWGTEIGRTQGEQVPS